VNRCWLFTLVALFALAACGTVPSTTESPPTVTVPLLPMNTPPPTATAILPPTQDITSKIIHPGLPLLVGRGELFSTSGACAICHTGLVDETGVDASIDTNWRSTMMANAARDPYFLASVRGEVLANPELGPIIEDKCSTCHMPMARFTAYADGGEGKMFEDGFTDPGNALHTLAMDGNSCTVCHQIRETNLGLESSYSGGFVIDTELRSPNRLIFGPHTIDDDPARIMQNVSGFRPEQGLHLSESELCATCHTLYTPYVDATGNIAGEFPEQTPYFEWFYSDYRRTQTCQDCHMPEAEGGVTVSNLSQVLRSPFSKHVFVGGNAYIIQVLKEFGEELMVTASSEQFEATKELTIEQLGSRTATITFDEVRLSGSRIIADVVIEVLTGHKFPTGFPSRRAWIHFVVHDSDGEVIFESGAVNPDGSIAGNDNDVEPGEYEQHYLAIVQPEQVQIYEAIIVDTEYRLTTTLLRAKGYVKDNRLLPSGFEKAAPYEDIAVHGMAREDEDFQGGGDEIQYIADVGSSEGPFVVTVEILYQSIGYRWAENFRLGNGSEIERFLDYYNAIPNLPVVVARAMVSVGE